ncbi:M48 family metalloprotease [Amylibacter sp.]|jgi:putative metalloprotease|nr:M48 family metalloprotease [Amylibacter sp.]MDA9329181.1 M48 family metalloprotease [bacterium]MDA9074047.1 M48 family metalloprotease [Amylibacter sp.]MDA9229730.1 M48 family metalloprotease [Amylibacter sp.]MDA9242839.1 M48 family metalloprotease [Amylibacter sp.]|tara:strand:+ start:838 stop:1515 length:678 start_codon:yes stop_codon:yes gene_type:complete
MLKFSPILIAILWAVIMYYISAWRTKLEMDSKSTLLNDPPLEALTNQMADTLDLSRIKVHIYEIEPINGLAIPDGRIFITRGFMKKYYNGEITAPELASVIAHELGHVALGHTKRRMIDFSSQNAIRVALAMFLSRFLGGFGTLIANTLTKFITARLSRKDEYEADAYAAALLTKAKIGIEPQISMFEKLEKLNVEGNSSMAWMMSHPKTKDRISAIKKLKKEWK